MVTRACPVYVDCPCEGRGHALGGVLSEGISHVRRQPDAQPEEHRAKGIHSESTRCKCRKYAIDPCCKTHGIGSSRYVLNLVGMVAVVFLVALVVLTAPADSADSRLVEQRPVGLVICDVFGERYCADALEVAWCESRFKTTARNGQYLGLFQMGSWERRTFGHGRTAEAQARAAKRYFVATGKTWRPWSCKP